MTNRRRVSDRTTTLRYMVLCDNRGRRGAAPEWFHGNAKICQSLGRDGFLEHDPVTDQWRVTRNGVLESLRLEAERKRLTRL